MIEISLLPFSPSSGGSRLPIQACLMTKSKSNVIDIMKSSSDNISAPDDGVGNDR